MSLLFDENLSPLLPASVADVYPGSVHAREVGLLGLSDADVWQYAAQHNLTLVTKDNDFVRMSQFQGHPPKVIWLRIGNWPTSMIEKKLRSQAPLVLSFLTDPTTGCFIMV